MGGAIITASVGGRLAGALPILEFLEQCQLQAGWCIQPNVQRSPGRLGRLGDDHRALRGQRASHTDGIGDLEGDPYVRTNRSSDLDVVDHCHLRTIRDLERGAAGIQNCYPGIAVSLERCELGQTECIPVERDRAVVVVGGDDHSKLAHGPCKSGLSRAARLQFVLSVGHEANPTS
jgi:hypothetical protein